MNGVLTSAPVRRRARHLRPSLRQPRPLPDWVQFTALLLCVLQFATNLGNCISSVTSGTGSTAYQTAYAYNAVPASVSPTPTVGANQLKSVKQYLGSTLLSTISYLDSSGNPLYDELGRSLGQSIDGTASSQTYDTLGRIDTATNALTPTGHFAYAYLGNTGRVSSVTNPNSQSTVYTYQDSTTTPNEPRLSEIKNLNASAAVISKFNYGYDAQGQITSWTQQTDTNHPQNDALQYDAGGRLLNANLTDTTTSAVLHQYAYTYDPAGNRTSEQIDGNIVSASSNNLNQMTAQAAGGNMVFSGTLTKPGTVTVGGNAAPVDSNNNFRGTASVTAGVNTIAIVAHDFNGNVKTRSYQVTIPSTSSSYTYDYNGNLTSDGSRTFEVNFTRQP